MDRTETLASATHAPAPTTEETLVASYHEALKRRSQLRLWREAAEQELDKLTKQLGEADTNVANARALLARHFTPPDAG